MWRLFVGKTTQKEVFKGGITKSNRAATTWQLVYTNVCEPIVPTSLGMTKYFIKFVDDFSRKIRVYFLKEKSEALNAFKKFKTFVEKQRIF